MFSGWGICDIEHLLGRKVLKIAKETTKTAIMSKSKNRHVRDFCLK